MSQVPRQILTQLITVFDELHSLAPLDLQNSEQGQSLEAKRHQLTQELHECLPETLDEELAFLVQQLKDRTVSLLAQLDASQQELRDEMLKIQQQRKAKSVYKQVGTR